jgi:hypothetical protein
VISKVSTNKISIYIQTPPIYSFHPHQCQKKKSRKKKKEKLTAKQAHYASHHQTPPE